MQVLICVSIREGSEWGGEAGVGRGGWPSPASFSGRPQDTQKLLKSSFFLLQSICGARLLPRFW